MPHNAHNRIKNLSVDCVVLGFVNNGISVLLYKRSPDLKPYPEEWALSGGFVQIEESLEEAARRILEERTGIKDKTISLEQIQTRDEIDRFPEGRVITIVYLAFINPASHELKPGADSIAAEWFPIKGLPWLPFDHTSIVQKAFAELKWKVRHQPVSFKLLPKQFTLSELHQLYEAILEAPLVKTSFRRKILSMELLEPSTKKQKKVPHRPSKYYSFNPKKYSELKEKGFVFDFGFKKIPVLIPEYNF